MDEYIKAWCALKVLSKVYGLGDPNGFVFNMSVGYDLEGVKGDKVNTYIDGMKDANKTAIFGECKAVLKELFPAESDYIDAIDPRVSRSVTVSTLHGCPAGGDRAHRHLSHRGEGAAHLREVQPHSAGLRDGPLAFWTKWATTTSCSTTTTSARICSGPTRCPCSSVSRRWPTARVWSLASNSPTPSRWTPPGVSCPTTRCICPGRSLFPLTIEMCHRISRQFKGKMRISFAGGAEFFNCDKLFAAGIWPITVATTILKPGGYNRLSIRWWRRWSPWSTSPFGGTDTQAICELSAASHTDARHVKPIKPLPSRKS